MVTSYAFAVHPSSLSRGGAHSTPHALLSPSGGRRPSVPVGVESHTVQQQCVWLQVEHARKFGLSGRSSSLQLSAVSHQCRRPPLAGLLRCSCQRFHTSVVVLGSTSRSTKEPRVSSMLHVEQCGCACAWVPRSAHACAVRSVPGSPSPRWPSVQSSCSHARGSTLVVPDK